MESLENKAEKEPKKPFRDIDLSDRYLPLKIAFLFNATNCAIAAAMLGHYLADNRFLENMNQGLAKVGECLQYMPPITL